jgi:DNA (cytosine-5)-methyltransferase 1
MTGIDHKPQPRYVGEQFYQMDVFDVLQDKSFVRSFDFLHMSPPCQWYSQTRHMKQNSSGKVDALTPALEWIQRAYSDMLIIVENVERAPLEHPHHQCLMLCGSSFGLSGIDERRQLRRHRKFRLYNFRVPEVPCAHNGFRPLGVYGVLRDNIPGGGQTAANIQEARKLMGIEWMKWLELKEAIPPVYTEYIGGYLS